MRRCVSYGASMPNTDRRMPTVMPAIRLNANDTRRDSGGAALRWLHISATNDAQISTKHAYAKAMGYTPSKFPQSRVVLVAWLSVLKLFV